MLANVAVYINYLPTILWLGKMLAFQFTCISFFQEKKTILNISELDKNVKKYKMPLGFNSQLKIACKESLEMIILLHYALLVLKYFFKLVIHECC